VVIYDENVSFDHYFATYPRANNGGVGPTFRAASGTPVANNLLATNLLTNNPNLYPPTRLRPSQAMTCDQNHSYRAEQQAANNGRNDQFVQHVSVDECTGLSGMPGLTMGYYDGNTVTALWNYAQHYAMSDNSFSSTFGPSSVGAINLVSGQTHGVTAVLPGSGAVTTDHSFVGSPDSSGVGTIVGDADPAHDDCSDNNHTASDNLASMSGENIGDLLNAHHITWGWFQGGFRPTKPYAGPGTHAACGASHANIGGARVADYSAHHNPFQYYTSTSNPHHLPPTSVHAIGTSDQANHNYDLSDFAAALSAGIMPAVSFLKPAAYQDGHAGYSDPIDEQHFLVSEIDTIEQSRFWSSTAIVVAYDDSDGWYDHVSSPVLNGSADPALDTAMCSRAVATKGMAGGYADRCGPGTRQPLLVISPYAKTNFIDHTATEQASIIRFIEDNWGTGRLPSGSFDQRAGTLDNLFDFGHAAAPVVLLDANGSVRPAQ
jgi:phospholipase C